MTDKCKSWMGHNFEARYDIGEPNLSVFKSFSGFQVAEMMEALKPKKYVHDVCTRCGAIVERNK